MQKVYHLTAEHRRKIGLANMGRPSAKKGKKLSAATVLKIKAARARQVPPTLGRHHTEVTKHKIRLGNQGKIVTEAQRTHLSVINIGDRHPQFGTHKSEESRKKIGLALKGVKLSEAHKLKLRAAARDRVQRDIGTPGAFYGRKPITGYFKSVKSGKALYYASSFELAAYMILDRLSKVKSFGRCPIAVPYISTDNQAHWYIPDIQVEYTDDSKEVIEIKPRFLLNDENNVRKFFYAEEFFTLRNIAYAIWSERELKAS